MWMMSSPALTMKMTILSLATKVWSKMDKYIYSLSWITQKLFYWVFTYLPTFRISNHVCKRTLLFLAHLLLQTSVIERPCRMLSWGRRRSPWMSAMMKIPLARQLHVYDLLVWFNSYRSLLQKWSISVRTRRTFQRIQKPSLTNLKWIWRCWRRWMGLLWCFLFTANVQESP